MSTHDPEAVIGQRSRSISCSPRSDPARAWRSSSRWSSAKRLNAALARAIAAAEVAEGERLRQA
jgi:hypothetical protein